jgi:hypothetical protein
VGNTTHKAGNLLTKASIAVKAIQNKMAQLLQYKYLNILKGGFTYD